jgi:hypothetical protein
MRIFAFIFSQFFFALWHLCVSYIFDLLCALASLREPIFDLLCALAACPE